MRTGVASLPTPPLSRDCPPAQLPHAPLCGHSAADPPRAQYAAPIPHAPPQEAGPRRRRTTSSGRRSFLVGMRVRGSGRRKAGAPFPSLRFSSIRFGLVLIRAPSAHAYKKIEAPLNSADPPKADAPPGVVQPSQRHGPAYGRLRGLSVSAPPAYIPASTAETRPEHGRRGLLPPLEYRAPRVYVWPPLTARRVCHTSAPRMGRSPRGERSASSARFRSKLRL